MYNALKNYLSTPKFVVALTDISLALIHQTDRKQYLKEELTKLNQRLPASVYIPFVSSNVQHVLTSICRLHQKLHRAPHCYRGSESLSDEGAGSLVALH